ncbi:MAG: hypothetical protein K9G46_01175 [Flavobacteriales bacterium]|nr:hypothetical protein [Flavobacteriales bacterium]
MKNKLFLLLVLFASLIACDQRKFTKATVKDFGPPAVDGCGWVMEIDGTVYKPIDLPAKYQVDELKIEVKYDVLATMAGCGWVSNAYEEIDLIKIR